MAGFERLGDLLKSELRQLSEEGREVDFNFWTEKINACDYNKEKLMTVYAELCKLPMRSDFSYNEPSELDEIERESDISFLADDAYEEIDIDFFRGAWLGRCVGCALGQPCENWQSENITDWYKNAGKYPIRSYFPTHSGENTSNWPSTDENINGMPFDDDTRFTVLNYMLLKNKGYNIDSWDIADHWTRLLPYRFIFTAEAQGYLNFINLDECLHNGKPENAVDIMRSERVNSYLNPYREFIGAQIRADAFAYVAAGMPKLASRLAHSDAYFTHVKNGIYGEMFFAALISAAFKVKNVDECIDIAFSVVPKNSRFYEEMLWAREIAESGLSREKLMKTLVERAARYHRVHTINNAAICLASIVRYKNNFGEAVAFAVECGYDTDCNGATVGSFLGALLGESAIPDYFAVPIKDTFSIGITPYDNYSIRKFADEVKVLHDELNK